MVKVYVLVDNKVVDLRPPGMKAEWVFLHTLTLRSLF